VTAFDTDDVFVVGQKGAVVRFDGEAWIRSNLGPFNGYIYGLGGRSSDDLWAVGESGAVFHLQPQRFTKHFTSLTGADFKGLAHTTANDFWMETNTQSFRWDGATLGLAPNPPPNPIGMFFVDASDRWVIDSNGASRYDATTSTWVASPFYQPPSCGSWCNMWGAAANDIWIADNYLSHWDGTTWTYMSLVGNVSQVYALWGTATNDVWAGGFPALSNTGPGLYNYDGTKWNQMTLPNSLQTSPAIGISAGLSLPGGEVWAVANRGAIVHRPSSGGTFATVASGVTVNLTGIASNGDGVFVVGQTGTILKLVAGAWQPQLSGASVNLAAIGAAGASGDLWAIGTMGTVLRRAKAP
jgi:hypothetical protein